MSVKQLEGVQMCCFWDDYNELAKVKLKIYVVFSSLAVNLRDRLKLCFRDGVGLLKFLYGWLIPFKGLSFCGARRRCFYLPYRFEVWGLRYNLWGLRFVTACVFECKIHEVFEDGGSQACNMYSVRPQDESRCNDSALHGRLKSGGY